MSLKIEKLKVCLQGNEILHEIDLEVKAGEFISLLGPSGCGKTTLLKSIAGLLEIESGEIFMDGASLKQVAPEQRGTIIVFQDLRLFPHMTVEKNIAFAMELKGVPKKEQKERVKALLEEVQLSGYENRKMREMSGGQMQRVALARALAANPKVLLLDEPFSGLDEKLRNEMGALIKKLHEEKKLTIILVTHDKREALQMSEHIALMQEGEILQYDTPEKIYQNPSCKAVAEYFGKCNYIKGIVEKGQFLSEEIQFAVEKEEGMYELMIRPFQVQLRQEEKDWKICSFVYMGETVEILLEKGEKQLISIMMADQFERQGLSIGDYTGICIQLEAQRTLLSSL